jgi:hypothetical protein
VSAYGEEKAWAGQHPRRKRFKRAQRLVAAPRRASSYIGKDIARGYRKRCGVDWHKAHPYPKML